MSAIKQPKCRVAWCCWAGVFLWLCTHLAVAADAPSATLRVAVASNFTLPLQSVLSQFEAQTGVKVQTVTGASGLLAAQIQRGAPFDVFLSADRVKPQQLAEAHFGAKPFIYAQGQLLWVSRKAPSPQGLPSRLALPNPALAPYGQAADAWLRQRRLPKPPARVLGDDVQKTYHFVVVGAVDVALVSASLESDAQGRGFYTRRLGQESPLIQQAGLVLNRCAYPAYCAAFAAFLQDEAIQQRLANWGYVPVASRGNTDAVEESHSSVSRVEPL
jgi:molybdate transport system substrate-binding protein